LSRYQYEFPVSRFLAEGDWSDLVQPEIIEFYPTGEEAHNENSFNRLLAHYHLSIIISLASMELDHRDFAKNTNKYSSRETYLITWRAIDYNTIYEVLQRTRRICNDVDPGGYYARMEIVSPVFVKTTKYWRGDGQLNGWLSGKVITENVKA